MVNLERMRYLIRRYPMACLRAEQARIKAQRLTREMSDAPRGGDSGNSTEAGILLHMAAVERKEAIEAELKQMRKELTPFVEKLEVPLEVQCMKMRYLEGRSVREISYNLAYSEQHIFRIVANAEKKVKAIEEKKLIS